MKIQKLYTTIKPYAVVSIFVLGISSLSVSAMGHNKNDHNTENKVEMSQHKGEGGHKHHGNMKKSLRLSLIHI